MTPDKELAYQARIRELRGALALLREEIAENLEFEGRLSSFVAANQKADAILSRPDDLSALDAYVLEEKRKALRQMAVVIRASKNNHDKTDYIAGINIATEIDADAIEKAAEELK